MVLRFVGADLSHASSVATGGGSVSRQPLGQDREPPAVEEAHDVEVPVVQGHDRLRSIAGGKDDDRRIRDADRLVRVALDQLARNDEVGCIEDRQVPCATRQLRKRRQLGVDTVTLWR